MSSPTVQHSSLQAKAADDHNANSATINLQASRRKIDWQIVPIMFLCYTMQFLDKVNINVRIHCQCQLFSGSLDISQIMQYAAVMGLNKDLALTGNDFSNASTAFFIAYLIAEVPNSRFFIICNLTRLY